MPISGRQNWWHPATTRPNILEASLCCMFISSRITGFIWLAGIFARLVCPASLPAFPWCPGGNRCRFRPAETPEMCNSQKGLDSRVHGASFIKWFGTLYAFREWNASVQCSVLSWEMKILETEGYELLFPPSTEVFIYVSTIYLQSSGVIYNIKYY